MDAKCYSSQKIGIVLIIRIKQDLNYGNDIHHKKILEKNGRIITFRKICKRCELLESLIRKTLC